MNLYLIDGLGKGGLVSANRDGVPQFTLPNLPNIGRGYGTHWSRRLGKHAEPAEHPERLYTPT